MERYEQDAQDEQTVRSRINVLHELEAKRLLCAAVGIGSVKEKLHYSKFLGELFDLVMPKPPEATR